MIVGGGEMRWIQGGRRTDLGSSVHSEDVDTLDDGRAGVVYTVEHGLDRRSGGQRCARLDTGAPLELEVKDAP